MSKSHSETCLLFRGLVDSLFEHQRLTSSEADDAKAQFDDFLTSVVRPSEDIFSNFDYTSSRLDEFLSLYLAGEKE